MLINGLIIIGSILVFQGCSEDDDAPTATVDCAALITTFDTTEAAFIADQTTETCNALLAAAQSGFDGGCTFCAAGAAACLADGSNETTCCDEPTQADLDELTTICSGDFTDGTDGTATVPSSYTFDSRFNDGESSVSYSGQTTRNMLISAIKSTINGGGTTAAALTSLFNNDDATATYDGAVAFHDVSTKNLSGKISSDIVVGYDMTPTELIMSWFDAVESYDYYMTPQGLNIDQMVGKSLLGMVSYYQATSVYFNKVLELGEDNTNASSEGSAYTDMEHHFDEAFGYFGAAVGYQGQLSSERQQSGTATTAAEYTTLVNFDWAKYASKRSDLTGCSQSTGLDDALIEAFTMGRHLIATEATTAEIEAQIAIVLEKWEHVIVANIIHYAAEVQGLMAAASDDFNCSMDADCSKYWSEMAPFAISLQFNDDSMLSTSEFTELQSVIGMTPPTTNTESDRATFDTIISWLTDKYMLDADCSNW